MGQFYIQLCRASLREQHVHAWHGLPPEPTLLKLHGIFMGAETDCSSQDLLENLRVNQDICVRIGGPVYNSVRKHRLQNQIIVLQLTRG